MKVIVAFVKLVVPSWTCFARYCPNVPRDDCKLLSKCTQRSQEEDNWRPVFLERDKEGKVDFPSFPYCGWIETALNASASAAGCSLKRTTFVSLDVTKKTHSYLICHFGVHARLFPYPFTHANQMKEHFSRRQGGSPNICRELL